jgi:hypothetical protein
MTDLVDMHLAVSGRSTTPAEGLREGKMPGEPQPPAVAR